MAAGGGGIGGGEGSFRAVYEATRMLDFLQYKDLIEESEGDIDLFDSLADLSNLNADELREALGERSVTDITDSESFRKITELFHAVVDDSHGSICGNIYKLHGKPEGDPEYGSHHLYDSSFDLIAAILLTQHLEDTDAINYVVSHLAHGPEARKDSTWEGVAEEYKAKGISSSELSDKVIDAIAIVEYAKKTEQPVESVVEELSGIAWLFSGLEEGDPQRGERKLTEPGIASLALRIVEKKEEFARKIHPLFPDAIEEDIGSGNLHNIARTDTDMAKLLFNSEEETVSNILDIPKDFPIEYKLRTFRQLYAKTQPKKLLEYTRQLLRP